MKMYASGNQGEYSRLQTATVVLLAQECLHLPLGLDLSLQSLAWLWVESLMTEVKSVPLLAMWLVSSYASTKLSHFDAL